MSNMTFRPYREGDETAILQLFETTYGQPLPLDVWRWRFGDGNPAGPGVIHLAWDGDVLAAHYAITRVVMSIDGDEQLTGLSGTTMTHPDYRGQGLFPRLARDAYGEMTDAGMTMVWGFPNSNSHRGFIQDLAWRDVAELPMLRYRLGARALPAAPANVVEADAVDASFDELWSRADYRVAVKRDARYLRWRFLDNPSQRYRLLVAREGGTLLGYAFLKRYRDEVQIIDIHAVSTDVAQGLVLGANAEAVRDGATSLALWIPLTTALHRALERLGFMPDAPVTYFSARQLRGERESVYSPFAWYTTMGDSDVF